MSNQRFFMTVPIDRTIEQTMCPKCLNPTATLIQTHTNLCEKEEIVCYECNYYWDNSVFTDPEAL